MKVHIFKSYTNHIRSASFYNGLDVDSKFILTSTLSRDKVRNTALNTQEECHAQRSRAKAKHAHSHSQSPGSRFHVKIRTINYINKVNSLLGNYKETKRKCAYFTFPNEEKWLLKIQSIMNKPADRRLNWTDPQVTEAGYGATGHGR